jgi:phosphate-selective porin OprO/OprP
MSDRSVRAGQARTKLWAILVAGVSTAALAQTAAHAQTTPAAPADPREARIEQLENEVQELAGEVQDLKRNQAEQIQTLANVERKTPPPPSATVSILNGKPSISSADGRFTANLHGIIQLDAADYDQASPGPTSSDFRRSGPAIGTPSVDAAHARDLKNGDVFRRARIGVDGTVYGDWDYRLIFDFAGSGTENAGQLYEAWAQYSAFKPFHLRVGAFAPSIGLDDQASTNSMPFLERAASSDIARGLAAGDTRTAVELFANKEHWLVSGAVTGKTIGVINSSGAAVAQTFGDQLGLVGRAAISPFHGDDWLIHFGVHGSYVVHPADSVGPSTTGATLASGSVIGFSNTPELRVDGTKLINTGNIIANHADTLGAEFAAQKRNFLLQAEYEDFGVQRNDGFSSPNFHGYYVSGTWLITGETRKYNSQTAAFDGPSVAHPFSPKDGAWGAWELAVRYSDMDLNYKAGAAGTYQTANGIRGGDEQIVTAGVNWYVNPVIRFMFDYQHVKVDRLSPATNAAGSTTWLLPANTVGEGAQIGQSYNVFSVRSQVAF